MFNSKSFFMMIFILVDASTDHIEKLKGVPGVYKGHAIAAGQTPGYQELDIKMYIFKEYMQWTILFRQYDQ